jgi:Protein of unknown function (DUF1631)
MVMVQGISSSFGRGTGGGTPVSAIRLAQRRDLPLRVRNVLAGLLPLCSGSLISSLNATLGEFEQELLKLAGKARTSADSQRCFESLRQVRRGGADISPRLAVAIDQALARFDREDGGESEGEARTALKLVDAGDLEESLVLQEIATKCEVRQALLLHDLGHRFAVLAGRPAFDADEVPLGPNQILAALCSASTALNMPGDHRILLFHTFDRVALGVIGKFYETLNAYLVEHRILRNLRVHAPRKKDRSAHHAPAAGGGVPGQRMPAATAAADDSGKDQIPFATLRELLAGRRRALGTAGPTGAAGYVPSAADLQTALAQLQAAARAGDGGPTPATRLKQDLLDQLQRGAARSRAPRLAGEDADTIDLIGMLFEQLAHGAPATGKTQAILSGLHVPLLRVALHDKAFFTEHAHPARLLLNAVAEAGLRWIDDSEGESDPMLLKKMHAVIERLNNEFDGSLSLIERMLGDLSEHMQVLAHKAEVSERRLVDATRGRERLALAREAAGDAIAERIAAARPGRLLRTMLEQAWTDVLALTVLRHGEDSEAYRLRLGVVDRLIAGTATRESTPSVEAALRRDVESGLAQVGYHPDEIHAVVQHLLAPSEAANDEGAGSRTEVAIRLKTGKRLGEGGEQRPRRAAAQRRAVLRLDATEERMLEHLKSVPFGTWFEFAVNQQGDRVRRKLSWYSTVTGHCLFVNHRGVRCAEPTLEQLARDIVRGQANIAPAVQESLVDRAWKAIVSSLRQLTARGAEALAPRHA